MLQPKGPKLRFEGFMGNGLGFRVPAFFNQGCGMLRERSR
jgi:hypothetical protein